MAFNYTKSNLILCEGTHDRAFFRAIRHDLGLDHLFQTTDPSAVLGARGGNSQWLKVLTALIGTSGFERLTGLIIVGDNDNNPAQSMRNIRDALKAAPIFPGPPRRKLVVPQALMRKTGGIPVVAIIPIPKVRQKGSLETLCIQAAQVSPALALCADDFLACSKINSWGTSKQSKVKMRALIAASHRTNPEMTLSRLWVYRPDLVPINHVVFQHIANFLRAF